MRVQAAGGYSFALSLIVASSRAQQPASAHFTNARIHQDYTARARAALREFKHVDPWQQSFPAAQRVGTYLPTFAPTGNALYALRGLEPAGTLRELIDEPYDLEITRIRWAGTLALAPEAYLADATLAEGIERNIEDAIKALFVYLEIPTEQIGPQNAPLPEQSPGSANLVETGDQDLMIESGTTISISVELGASIGRTGYEVSTA